MTCCAHTLLQEIPGSSRREISALAEAGISTVAQLLEVLPRRYEDRRRFDAFPRDSNGKSLCLKARVVDAKYRFFGKNRFAKNSRYFEVIVDESVRMFGTRLTCRWFHLYNLDKTFAAGQEVILFGKIKSQMSRQGPKLIMDQPEFEAIDENSESKSIHLERVVPIYRAIQGIHQRRLREFIWQVLQQVVPDSLREIYPLNPDYPRAQAIRDIHFPETLEGAQKARAYFALEEFFALQLNIVWRKHRQLTRPGKPTAIGTTAVRDFATALPFALTGAQKRSINEIYKDMRTTQPMHRLLQGDVGSGKTLVALSAMLIAVEAGYQAALMAPTQILAEQHFQTAQKFLGKNGPFNLRLSLRTASKDHDEHLPIEGEPQIVIGTHALLFDRVSFSNLGLVVIDEQHKFGVAQRGKLIQQGTSPDVLVMTATPIPRTLTLTIYGDLDVSILDELPAGREKIVTVARPEDKLSEITKFVIKNLEEGRQAYIVSPLVEESETKKAKSATTEFEAWKKRLPHFEVGLLHGRQSADEKDAVMRKFRDGKLQVLVATTVIEVGVDVANANIMIINNADQFGLAQLHQLRGRIGRGSHKSYCILLTSKTATPQGLEKVRIMEETTDGFRIAEEDLKLRGPGDMLGTAQSGLGNLRFIDQLGDLRIVAEARRHAEKVIKADPNLEKNIALRDLLTKESTSLIA